MAKIQPNNDRAPLEQPISGEFRRRQSFVRFPSLRLGGVVAGFTVLGLLVAAVDRGNPEGEAVPEPAAVTTGGEESVPVASNAADGQASAAIAAPVLIAAASIPPLADLVQRIGGDRVEVVSIVPQGVDGHTYEPTPSDVVGLTQVDVKFFASRDLNPAVTRTVETNLPSSALTVDLMDLTVPTTEVIADISHSHGSGGSHSHANVHVWTDPTIAMRWVGVIRDQLEALEPSGAGWYRVNAATVTAQLQALHDAIVAATATVPEPQRTLVVYHDSWSYFGRTYGYRVLGALQAADFAEPSAGEMRDMVEQVRDAGVPAFFGAAVFPTEVLRRVSEEARVPYVADLADDELPGEPGEPRHSYLGMMIDNVRHIVNSLGGDDAALDGVPL